MIEELKQMALDWPGEVVVIRHDEATGAWIFIALHSTALGRPVGGTRMKVYDKPQDGLRDATRLAEGMTYKWATLDLSRGGGKAVIALNSPLQGPDRRRLLLRYGGLLESMDGVFGTGEDLGTTPDDMAVIAERTQYVHGVQPDGAVTDPGPFTANGVFHGCRSAVKRLFGADSLAGLTILVQGVGDVGAPLARQFAADGAKLLLSDLTASRVEPLAAELGATIVPNEAVYETPCDIFAPCAIGGILNRDTVGQLRCRMVSGSANNQLQEPGDGEALNDRGIVYLPDYVLNAGGALALGTATADDTEAVLMARVERIGVLIDQLLVRVAESGESTATAARRIAEERLAAAAQEDRAGEDQAGEAS